MNGLILLLLVVMESLIRLISLKVLWLMTRFGIMWKIFFWDEFRGKPFGLWHASNGLHIRFCSVQTEHSALCHTKHIINYEEQVFFR